MSACLGRMRVRIRVERPLPISDETGGVATFEDAGGAWAAITAVTAADLRTRYTLVLRLRHDIQPGWRVVLGDRRLRVTAIAVNGARLTLDGEHDFA